MDGERGDDWTQHLGLVLTWANDVHKSVRHLGVRVEDLIAGGNVVLWQCMQPGKYDASRGNRPATYIMKALSNRTNRIVAAACGFSSEKMQARHQSIPTTPISNDGIVRDHRQRRHGPYDERDDVDLADQIQFVFRAADLTPAEEQTLLKSMQGLSHKAIALELGISAKAVAWRLSVARHKIEVVLGIADDADLANEEAVGVESEVEPFVPPWPMEPIVLKVTDRGVQ